MKRFTYPIVFLFALTTTAFASNGKPAKTTTLQPATVNVLSAEEMALEAELTEELEINVADVIAELASQPTVNSVKVFDLAGNQIASQEGKIDFSKIPAGAELLMTEGATQFYIINR